MIHILAVDPLPSVVEAGVSRLFALDQPPAGHDRETWLAEIAPRIRGLATANPWWGARALDELARCRDLGAVGLFLDPARQGPIQPVQQVIDPRGHCRRK